MLVRQQRRTNGAVVSSLSTLRSFFFREGKMSLNEKSEKRKCEGLQITFPRVGGWSRLIFTLVALGQPAHAFPE